MPASTGQMTRLRWVNEKDGDNMNIRNSASALSFLAMAAHACAEGTLAPYGIADVSVRHANDATPSNRSILDDGQFYASRIGLNGSEDLQPDLKAVVVLEAGFDPSTGNTTPAPTATASYGQAATTGSRLFGRQSYVGLASTRFGALTFGRQFTLAHIISGKFQPNTNPNSAPLAVLPGWQGARQDNMVKYLTDIGPLNLGASYAFSEGANGKAYGVSAGYTFAPIEILAYGQRMDNNASATDHRKIFGAGFDVALPAGFKAYGGYMKRTQTASTVENNILLAALTWSATPELVLTASGTLDHETAFATTPAGSRKVYFVEAEYHFTHATSLYAELDRNQVQGGYALPAFMLAKGTQNGGAIGLEYRF
jgi:predicted porin